MVSDNPLHPIRRLWEERLRGYTIDNKPVLDLEDPRHQQALEKLLTWVDWYGTSRRPDFETFESGESLRRRLSGVGVITDDNMGTEWRQ